MIRWREFYGIEPKGDEAEEPEIAKNDLLETPPKSPKTSDFSGCGGHGGRFLTRKNQNQPPVADLIAEGAAGGVILYLDQGQVRIRLERQPLDDLVDRLRQRKPEILDQLRSQALSASLLSPTPTSDPACDPKAFDVLAAHLDTVIACQTSDQLADADVTYWRHQLDAMPAPANANTARALKHCRRIMFEPWVRDAARLGWTERDVWGYAGPRVKAGHGLALGLALATPRDCAKVISITADDAIIETAKGNRISVSRNDAHPPIWTCAC